MATDVGKDARARPGPHRHATGTTRYPNIESHYSKPHYTPTLALPSVHAKKRKSHTLIDNTPAPPISQVTLGPKGRNVVLERAYGAPEIVNDGVTIARDIEVADHEENVGVKLVQEVAQKSDNR